MRNGAELLSGERQVAETLDGIRLDHRARYEWAAERLAGSVLDVGCGIGYGSAILADAGCTVLGLDRSRESLMFAVEKWNRPTVRFGECDLSQPMAFEGHDAATCFELVEHLADPRPLLRSLAAAAPVLLVSVPNEAVFPFRNYRFHERHYRAHELETLLNETGWQVLEWWGQRGTESRPEPNVDGRTLIAVCEQHPAPTGGTSVAINEGPRHDAAASFVAAIARARAIGCKT